MYSVSAKIMREVNERDHKRKAGSEGGNVTSVEVEMKMAMAIRKQVIEVKVTRGLAHATVVSTDPVYLVT